MQETTIFKGYRIDGASITANVLKKNDVLRITPRFECKITGNAENYTAFITVSIVHTEENKTPFDLNVTISGLFMLGRDLADDKKGQLRLALQTLFPYLRAFVSTLTTACALPPFILPYVDVEQMVASIREQKEYVN